jgi:hypothetical protein
MMNLYLASRFPTTESIHARNFHRRRKLVCLAAALAFGLAAATALLGAASYWPGQVLIAQAGGNEGVLSPSSGTDWYVSKTGSDLWSCLNWTFPCKTVQGAVDKASSGDRIHVASGTYSEHLVLNIDLAITGTTPSGFIPTIISNTAAGATINVGASNKVTLANMNIRNAKSSTTGGAIYNTGSVTLTNVKLSNASATVSGAGIYNSGEAILSDVTIQGNSASSTGGGIYNHGSMTITNVTIQDNRANTSSGGGIYNMGDMLVVSGVISDNSASNYGGGIANIGQITIKKSRIVSNTAESYGGGGISNEEGIVTLEDVSIENNRAHWGGGMENTEASGWSFLTNVTFAGNQAEDGDGGGLYNSYSDIYLMNVTFSDNSAQASGSPDGGGLFNVGTGEVFAIECTIVYNHIIGSVNGAGGVGYSSGAAPKLENSIIAFNDNDNCSGALLSDYDRNIDSQGANTCGVADDLVGADPLLLPLGNNGGYVHTHLPGSGSAAIDNGENNGNVCPGYDARYFSRPIDGDRNGYAGCDIGAVEAGMTVFLPVVLK